MSLAFLESKVEPPDVHYLRVFQETLNALGITDHQRDAAFRAADVKPRRFWGHDIDMFQKQRFARALAEQTGDPYFGLRLGLAMPVGANGVVEYAALSAPTLREMHAVYSRLSSLFAEYVTYSLVEHGGYTSIQFQAPPIVQLDPRVEDFRMARLVSSLRRAFKQPDFAPSAVCFTYARPAQIGPYEQAFGRGAAIEFARRVPALQLPTSLVDRPLASSDPTLHSILVDHAERLLHHGDLPAKLSSRVRELLLNSLHEGRPSLNCVAKQLNMSERTLRRHLAEEGTSFGEILDHVRASLSEVLSAERSGKTLASKLGFESTSALRRAQKRWQGGSHCSSNIASGFAHNQP